MNECVGEQFSKHHPSNRLNTICPYFTMFPLSFPLKILNGAKPTDVVYDPFCGRGTTNYAARIRGLKNFGVDSNPVAYAIAQSKMLFAKPSSILSLCKDIINNTYPRAIPQGEFWEKAYHHETLVDLCRVREYLLSKKRLSKTEIALRGLILGRLHGPVLKTKASYLSNQMPRTFATKPAYSVGYWEKKSLSPQYVNLIRLVEESSKYFFNDYIPKKVEGKIFLGDSRIIGKIDQEKFDWIITSPPYFGMSTYEQDQWLRNWFLGGEPSVNYSKTVQIRHWSERSFVNDLSLVWANIAKKSNPNAKLVIRFGAIPSKSERNPLDIIKDSLINADSGWRFDRYEKAGKPQDFNRQANQFRNRTGNYIEEIDVFAVLNP